MSSFTINLREADLPLAARAAAMGKTKTQLLREIVAEFLEQPVSNDMTIDVLAAASGIDAA